MKAISLWQPWASAIALGNKKVETRSWWTKYRGPLAIHAAKRWQSDQREFASVEAAFGRLPGKLPFGAIVAVADLVDVKRTEELESDVDAIERIYGDYSAGRFGWILENVQALEDPVPFRGAQGLFFVPDNVVSTECDLNRMKLGEATKPLRLFH